MRGGQLAGAVLDANVLYSAFLRDVLLRLATAELFRPYWSERIHEEWTRNLLAHRPDLSTAGITRTRASMDAYFPSALVPDDEIPEGHFKGVAREDRHVAATARRSGASYIVTQNIRDFPAVALGPYGIQAVSADEFIRMLALQAPARTRAALEAHRLGLHPSTPEPRSVQGGIHPQRPDPIRRSALALTPASQSSARRWSSGSRGTSRGPFSSQTA